MTYHFIPHFIFVRVVILLDMSQSNANYLIHVQHSMRQLLEQQLLDKKYFNIIASVFNSMLTPRRHQACRFNCFCLFRSFGSEVRAFRPTLVKPTPENLQEAWRFVLQLHCAGSRNLMAALRRSLENEEEKQHSIGQPRIFNTPMHVHALLKLICFVSTAVDGVYLFTSGVPDQPQDVCASYLQERCCGCNLQLHVVLFNVDDYDASGAVPTRYANIAQTADYLRALSHSTDGRFHWFRETGACDVQLELFEIYNDDVCNVFCTFEMQALLSRMTSVPSLLKSRKL